ncbi:MAG: tRNA (adenosine(37)-N6)-threonylcarbamoyltransferase complex transferase subunit TsaD [Candidatus Omnitrophica bacterium]|nr:tRNA (adenosine(37)-N6)-threonylcarbamoyltransferase complex transferase subunit TsaD [Candidatus Omnitrophota bacterium]
MTILGIETSCDETGIGLLKNGKIPVNLIATQEEIHSGYGGIVPELASRAHLERIDELFTKALERGGIKPADIDYIGVTNHPGLKGSLMVGVSFACALAYALDIPVYKVNHLYSHLAANFMDPGVEFPALGLVISGGHTTFFYIENPVEFRVMGKTLDDACGETFDKAGRILGLGFPGGPHIEKAAAEGDEKKIKFPVALLDAEHCLDFSFSGLKTAVLYHVRKHGLKNIPDICAGFQKAAGDTLVEKTGRCMERYKVKSFLLGGGVTRNRYIRERFRRLLDGKGVKLFMPDAKLCLDNGAMIAAMTYFLVKYGVKPSSKKIEVIPTQ